MYMQSWPSGPAFRQIPNQEIFGRSPLEIANVKDHSCTVSNRNLEVLLVNQIPNKEIIGDNPNYGIYLLPECCHFSL